MRTDFWVQIFRSKNAVTHTFLNLTEGEALTLVDLVRLSGGAYKINDSSPDLCLRVEESVRTPWFKSDLPEGGPTKED